MNVSNDFQREAGKFIIADRLARAVRVIDAIGFDDREYLRRAVRSNMPEYRAISDEMDFIEVHAYRQDQDRNKIRFYPDPGDIDLAQEALSWLLLKELSWAERMVISIASVYRFSGAKNMPWKKKIIPQLLARDWPKSIHWKTVKRHYFRGLEKIFDVKGESLKKIY